MQRHAGVQSTKQTTNSSPYIITMRSSPTKYSHILTRMLCSSLSLSLLLWHRVHSAHRPPYLKDTALVCVSVFVACLPEKRQTKTKRMVREESFQMHLFTQEIAKKGERQSESTQPDAIITASHRKLSHSQENAIHLKNLFEYF